MLSVLFVSLATVATALPHGSVKRQVTELEGSYDFVIAGGGTTGLTIADRLTEAFPDSKFTSTDRPLQMRVEKVLT